MPEHIKESNEDHLTLAMKQITTLLSTTIKMDSTTIKMDNFCLKKTNDTDWYSPPFYSHPRGYKMCLHVDANGNVGGEGTHVSVFLYMMRGENDDNLVWPFQGEVSIALLNQLEDKNHREAKATYNTDERKDHNSRVTDGELGDGGYGKPKFVSHEELDHRADINCQYLKDDSLYFRVSVKVHEACKPWLTTTT